MNEQLANPQAKRDSSLSEAEEVSRSRIDRVRQFAAKIRFQSILGTVGTQLGIFGLHALHSIILARLLGPQGRGEYGAAVLFTQTFIYSGMLGISFSIPRRASSPEANLKQLSNAALRAGVVTGTLSFCGVLLLTTFALPSAKAYLAPLCIVSALALPIEHARLALLSVDHGASQFWRYNINRLIAAAVSPLLLFIVWSADRMSVVSAIWLSVLTASVSLLALLSAHRGITFQQGSVPSTATLLKEGKPYAISYFAGQLLGRIDLLLVLWMLNIVDQGYYAVASAASTLLQVVPNALSLYSFNFGASHRGRISRMKLLWAAIAVAIVQIGCAISLGLMLIFYLPSIFGSKFSHSIPMALALLPGFVIDGLAAVAEGLLRGKGRPLSTLFPRTAGGIVLVIAVLTLQPFMHELSIPIASSIAHTVCGISIISTVLFRQSVTDERPTERNT